MSLGWVVAIVGAARIALYYGIFQPGAPADMDRSHSLMYTISSAEVNMSVSPHRNRVFIG